MSNDTREAISSLKTIRQDIGDLKPQDGDSVIKVGASIEELISKLPDNMPLAVEVIMLCLQGLQAVYMQQARDFKQLVRAITAALVAIEQSLSSKDNPVCIAMLENTKQILQQSLQTESATQEEETASEAKEERKENAPINNLDDIATLLIQIDSSDKEELSRIFEALKTLAHNATVSEVKKALTKAAREINKVIQDKATDANDVLEFVGKLIDQVNEMESGTSAKEPVKEKAVKAEPAKEKAVESFDIEIPFDESETDEPPQVKKAVSNVVQMVIPPAATAQEATPAYDELPADADVSLLREFITESNELIEAAEAALLALETDPDDKESINIVFRAFHTVKGSSAFLGLKRLGELAHRAESLLSKIRDGEIKCTGGYATLSLRSVDTVKEMLESVQAAVDSGSPMMLPASYDELMRVLSDPVAAVNSEEATVNISEDKDRAEKTPPKRMRIGDILVAQKKVTREQVEKVNVEKGQKLLGEALRDLGFVSDEDIAEAMRILNQQNNAVKSTSESSVRVRTDRLDSLIDMVGELVIAQAMLSQDSIVQTGVHHELVRKVSHAGKIVRELQDLSMAMRMVPLRNTFQKIARVVRDVAQKCDKQVEFVTEGEDTEIDRNLVDIIADPLIHMARNAVDHGIETPRERRKVDKPRVGKIRLAAYHAGGDVVIELQDDGAGLDREKIAAKAISQHLIDSDKNMSDSEVFSLIFAPGFSTAEQVTAVSGRGVGMDVVRRNVEAMRGRVEISSEKGKGSLFTVRLPLTLAITDGMLVRVGEDRYIVPTVNIHLSFRPSANQLSTVSERGEMVLLRGELIPIFRLHRLFDVNTAVTNPTEGLLMVVADGKRRCALLVDELLGQQQMVVKSLGRGLGKIQGIAGGAILGDGRVGLILDTAEIIALIRQHASSVDRKDRQLKVA